ncbi:MAG: hypothetical protein D6B25_02270 [Desulfobulbaceae bacterium]|nr:MAG: hypothetical protein D6B25_02270 [Desulfobulbaceae bacterium]
MKLISRFCLILALIICHQLIVVGAFAGKKTEELSELIKESIEKTFPNSEITKIEKEQWNGQTVTEVELIAENGVLYEVFISDEGSIQKIEKEEGWGWFGK